MEKSSLGMQSTCKVHVHCANVKSLHISDSDARYSIEGELQEGEMFCGHKGGKQSG